MFICVSQVPFPRAFYADEETGTVIMEDLGDRGFSCVPAAPDGLDLRHAEEALTALARWHAFARVKLLSRPDFSSRYGEAISESGNWGASASRDKGIQQKSKEFHIKFLKEGIEKIEDLLEEKTRSALERFFEERLHSLVAEARAPGKDNFLTVAHGDMWNNNIMFRHQDGRVAEVKLVDLQCPMVSRPTIDLAHMIFQVNSAGKKNEFCFCNF